MTNTGATKTVDRRSFLQKRVDLFHKEWQLHLMIAFPVIWILIFCYWPLYGAQIAFKNYMASQGIWGSEWVGFENFQRFFSNFKFKNVIGNSLRISIVSLLAGFPTPIILALLINALDSRRFRKSVQLVTYAPYFISTVVMVGMIMLFLSPTAGLYGQIATALGIKNPPGLLTKIANFDAIYVLSGIWQGAGYGSIIYIAALANVDPCLYEAATIDGATRLQKMRFIDLPSLLPTAVILLILNMGSLMNVGFEKIFLLQNDLNVKVSEVISTYVYKVGLQAGFPDYSYSTAVGLFNSVISCSLVLTANAFARRAGGSSLW